METSIFSQKYFFIKPFWELNNFFTKTNKSSIRKFYFSLFGGRRGRALKRRESSPDLVPFKIKEDGA